jgi:hypothetical protein
MSCGYLKLTNVCSFRPEKVPSLWIHSKPVGLQAMGVPLDFGLKSAPGVWLSRRISQTCTQSANTQSVAVNMSCLHSSSEPP